MQTIQVPDHLMLVKAIPVACDLIAVL